MDKWVIKKPRLSDEASTSSGNDRSQTLSNVVLSSSTSQSVPVHSQNIEQIAPNSSAHDRASTSSSNDKSQSNVVLSSSTSQSVHSKNTEQSVPNSPAYDIGKIVNKAPANNNEKFAFLQTPWTPPPTFKFPDSYCGKSKRSFQRQWMNKYPWLVYSNEASGALCKFCVLFSHNFAGKGNHQKLGALVQKPFTNWKNAIEIFETHSKADYHINSAQKAYLFTKVMEGKNPDVVTSLTVENQKQAEENQKKLQAIVETIILCGRQNIALRGHKDSGIVGIEEPAHNDGNFRALLRFRAKTDENLKNHLLQQKDNSRSNFTCPTVQNEIINRCGKNILKEVVSRIQKAGYFAVLADETQDVSRHEQLALCVRYVDEHSEKTPIIREDFLQFIHVEDVTAESLAKTIMKGLTDLGLDLNLLVGQGYDGAAVMSGHLKGVRTLIAEKYPKAQFVHCSAHALNLVLAHSADIPEIRNCIGTIKSVINFFHLSPLRDGQLKKAAENFEGHSNLISLCETRWGEKHQAVERFTEMYELVLLTLENLENSKKDYSAQAHQLKQAMMNTQFVLALLILSKVFTYTSTLTKILQTVNIDLVETCNYVQVLIKTLEDLRSNENEFGDIVKKAKEMTHQDSLQVPRVSNRRSNAPADDPESHYKRNLYYPFLDHCVTGLRNRFSAHMETIANLQLFLPKFLKPTNEIEDQLKKLKELYLSEESHGALLTEYAIWSKHWQSTKTEYNKLTALDVLGQCNEIFFPLIRKLIKVLCVLPVSTATAERNFSALKRLKTYLKNTIGQERLTGLALLNIYREIQIDPKQVVVDMAKERHRFNLLI